MIVRYILILVFMLMASTACSHLTKQQPIDKQLVLPAFPALLTTPRERADFLVVHYWDNFDFRDTSLVARVDYTEQAFVDFLVVLFNVLPDQAHRGIDTMMTRAQVDTMMYVHFIEMSEKYLYDPNSPLRDQELYIEVLNAILANPALDEVQRIRPAYQLQQALKNRVGSLSTDFHYKTASASVGTLHQIQAQYTLVFFNNPDCEACKEIRDRLVASSIVDKMTSDGSLKILAMYVDQDTKAWRNYAHHIPAQWINAYDYKHVIQNDQMYDLRAIPNLYLLDRTKTVLIKDARIEQIEDYLQEINE